MELFLFFIFPIFLLTCFLSLSLAGTEFKDYLIVPYGTNKWAIKKYEFDLLFAGYYHLRRASDGEVMTFDSEEIAKQWIDDYRNHQSKRSIRY